MQWTLWHTLFLASVVGGLLAIPFEKTRLGGNIVIACGLMVWALVAGHGLDGYIRGHWHFNSLLVPEAVLAPDGNYTDGTPASDAERMLNGSSKGEAVLMWIAYACLAWSAWTLWGAWRNDRRRTERRNAMAEPKWRR